MILKQLYQKFLSELQNIYSKDEAAKITVMIFEWAAAVKRSDVLITPEQILPEANIILLNASLAKLLAHTPVQYVTGEAWFYQLKFKVASGVLIPRPETEELVEAALKFIKPKNDCSVIDIGSGSGCIPIAIKYNAPNSFISSVDISEEALVIARENAELHQTNITFIQLDFLDETSWTGVNKYDVIISNPPYIPEKEMQDMDKNVAVHEPHSALFVPDKTPIIFYKKIATFAQEHLKLDGKIFMETHEDFAKEVAEIFDQQNFTTEIKKDIFGKERMVMAIRCR